MAEAKVKKLLDQLSGAEIRQLGQLLAKMGEGGDTILAHITPEEAAMLKANGGSGEPNPKTGLPAFNDDGSGADGTGADGSSSDSGVGSGDGPGGSGDGMGQSGGDPGAGGGVGADTGTEGSTSDGGAGGNPAAPDPVTPVAAPAANPADPAKSASMAIPGATTDGERTARRAAARNPRASGLSAFRSDLLIGGVAGGSGLAIPR